MDNLLKLADLAIYEARCIRREVRQSFPEIRSEVARDDDRCSWRAQRMITLLFISEELRPYSRNNFEWERTTMPATSRAKRSIPLSVCSAQKARLSGS
jgi:hypothetical protein